MHTHDFHACLSLIRTVSQFSDSFFFLLVLWHVVGPNVSCSVSLSLTQLFVCIFFDVGLFSTFVIRTGIDSLIPFYEDFAFLLRRESKRGAGLNVMSQSIKKSIARPENHCKWIFQIFNFPRAILYNILIE